MKEKRETRVTKRAKQPLFVARAERAFRRVSEKLKTESRSDKLPVVVWENGKVVKKLI